MLLSEEVAQGEYIIRGYTDDTVTINETVYCQSLVISSNRLLLDWRPKHIDELTAEDLQLLSSFKPELVLLGTGAQFKLLSPSLLKSIENTFSIESMSTQAACRTYSALSSEGRNVIAALIITPRD